MHIEVLDAAEESERGRVGTSKKLRVTDKASERGRVLDLCLCSVCISSSCHFKCCYLSLELSHVQKRITSLEVFAHTNRTYTHIYRNEIVP